MEIITLQWSSNINTLENYKNHSNVIPALLGMLHQKKIVPEVYELIFTMLKNLISKSI